ncbi:MAG TPA: FAD-binding oxidoreductase [Ktedonobacteraceae bacterium]|nr:FAD-binding oxidoreductase [Ktedonobacteraceae bacterium]
MRTDSISYWQSTVSATPLSTKLPRMADVAVIGGGLMGTAACYWLARQGIPVALIERNALAAGATGRNGGFVVARPAGLYSKALAHLGHQTARAMMDVTLASRVLLRQVLQEEAIACDYREPGTIRLALSEEQVAQQHQEVDALGIEGFAAQWLDREDIRPLIRTPMAAEILGGRFLPEQGLVHSAKLVQGLMRAALHYGARAYQAEVQAILPEGNAVRLQTSRGTLLAGTVVVAANVWASKLLPLLADVIIPIREQMLSYAPVAPVFTIGISAAVTADEYWQQTPDGTILIGGCGSVAPNEDVGIWENSPTQVVQDAIEQILPRLFPALASMQVAQRWAGLLDYTTDNHPIVDRVPDMPNVFFLCGFSGHGMPYGMRFGQLLAETVQSRELSPALQPFRLDRPTLRKWSATRE